VPPSAADHDALGKQTLARRDDLADNVLQRKLALFERPGLSVPSSGRLSA
jgi:hypothetical protein